MTATMLLPPAEVARRTEAWHTARRPGVSASEIAAVLGISPWESPFSLYWRKVNGWDVEQTDEMRAGLILEPAIADWWADEQDPLENLVVAPAGLYGSEARPWQLATPDRLVHMVCPGCDGPAAQDPWCDCRGAGTSGDPLAVLECKWVAHSWDGWGEPGTDDIPVYYRAQVLQQLDVLDLDDAHVAALGPGGFRSFWVRRDERDLAVMRRAGALFVERLANGNPPDVDEHSATITVLKLLHPTVRDRDIDVPVDFAEGYRRARAARARAQSIVDRYEARARATLGDARRLMCNRRIVVSRSVYERKPYEVGPATIDRLNPGRAQSYV